MNLSYFIALCYLCCTFWRNMVASLDTELEVLKINENEIDYGDEDDDVDNNTQKAKHNLSRHRSMDMIERVGVSYMWNRWEKWSKCANSCVQVKRRQCIQRTQMDRNSSAKIEMFYPSQHPSMGCFGILRKFRLCKEEKCRNNRMRSLRNEQCALVANKKPYNGKYYKWKGMQDATNECQLYCSALNTSQLILNMNMTVLDGTPCQRPAVYYTHGYRQQAVCVEGICRAVHVSGAIRPTTTNDSQMRCGSLLCKTFAEIYSQNKLNMDDYNLIAKLPAGSMNISIKQAAFSDNLLVLKSEDGNFIINGQARPYKSGIYEYNGDSFDYNHDASHIVSKGPLARPIILMVYAQSLNPGILYEYILPVPSTAVSEEDDQQTQWNELGQPIDDNLEENASRANKRRRRKFSWKLLGFGQCNRSCGPGVQAPIFRCIRDSPTRYYTPKRCAYMEKPIFSADIYRCNRGLCPAYWSLNQSDIDCNCTVGQEQNGTRARNVTCVQEQITGKVEIVAETLCDLKQKPSTTEACTCQQQLTRKILTRSTTEKSDNLITYARLTSANTPSVVRSIYNGSQPLRRHLRKDRSEKTGVWLMSNWQGQCDEFSCHVGGFDYRSVYCDRTAPFTDLCDVRYAPQQKRACAKCTASSDQGVWLVSPWSNCTGDCFNLQRQRIVLCWLQDMVVEDAACGGSSNKPATTESCQQEEVDFCTPKWHYSEWSECSRSCGEGQQRRYAKCLNYDWHQNTLVESGKCTFKEREPVFAACNIQKCEEINVIVENPQRMAKKMTISTTTPMTATCSDDFSNCKRINRQRLCKLQYYKSFCCQTCNNYV